MTSATSVYQCDLVAQISYAVPTTACVQPWHSHPGLNAQASMHQHEMLAIAYNPACCRPPCSARRSWKLRRLSFCSGRQTARAVTGPGNLKTGT